MAKFAAPGATAGVQLVPDVASKHPQESAVAQVPPSKRGRSINMPARFKDESGGVQSTARQTPSPAAAFASRKPTAIAAVSVPAVASNGTALPLAVCINAKASRSNARDAKDSPRGKLGIGKPPKHTKCGFCNVSGDGKYTGQLLGPFSAAGKNAKKTASVFTHNICMIWAPGVVEDDQGNIENVDIAVVAARKRDCAFCSKPGAAVKCCVDKVLKSAGACNKHFHYGCMIASGALPYTTRSTFMCICQEHARTIPVTKNVQKNFDCLSLTCKRETDIASLLYCCGCGSRWHPACLDMSASIDIAKVRDGWQCGTCKTCLICNTDKDDDQLVICECCDKAFHTYCLEKKLKGVPKSDWRCTDCTVCSDCGVTSSARWHNNFTRCDGCNKRRRDGKICPGCDKAYRDSDPMMVGCDTCAIWTHIACDNINEETYEYMGNNDIPYDCPTCRQKKDEKKRAYMKLVMEQVNAASVAMPVVIDEENKGKRKGKSRKRLREQRIQDNMMLPPEGVTISEMAVVQNKATVDANPAFENSNEIGKMVSYPTFFTDEYSTEIDLCRLCGSRGKEEEGQLIFCVQCGEGYHPFCVDPLFKITPKMLQYGWRCMDCMVCDICESTESEELMVICDDCDRACHTYCCNLKKVPDGAWKCASCVRCTDCGTNTSSSWTHNYTNCRTCGDLRSREHICPICDKVHRASETDQAVLECHVCQFWVHASCEQLSNEECDRITNDYSRHFNCAVCRLEDPNLPRFTPAPTIPGIECYNDDANDGSSPNYPVFFGGEELSELPKVMDVNSSDDSGDDMYIERNRAGCDRVNLVLENVVDDVLDLIMTGTELTPTAAQPTSGPTHKLQLSQQQPHQTGATSAVADHDGSEMTVDGKPPRQSDASGSSASTSPQLCMTTSPTDSAWDLASVSARDSASASVLPSASTSAAHVTDGPSPEGVLADIYHIVVNKQMEDTMGFLLDDAMDTILVERKDNDNAAAGIKQQQQHQPVACASSTPATGAGVVVDAMALAATTAASKEAAVEASPSITSKVVVKNTVTVDSTVDFTDNDGRLSPELVTKSDPLLTKDELSRVSEKVVYAKFAYKSRSKSEMSLTKGDLVVITRAVDEHWYYGHKLNETVNRFCPRNCMRPVSQVLKAAGAKSKDTAVTAATAATTAGPATPSKLSSSTATSGEATPFTGAVDYIVAADESTTTPIPVANHKKAAFASAVAAKSKTKTKSRKSGPISLTRNFMDACAAEHQANVFKAAASTSSITSNWLLSQQPLKRDRWGGSGGGRGCPLPSRVVPAFARPQPIKRPARVPNQSDTVLPTALVKRARRHQTVNSAPSAVYPTPLRSDKPDTRECVLCGEIGDGAPERCGRLLNVDLDRWVHVNCARWCAESYEREDGGLENIQKAVRRSTQLSCTKCNKKGATVGCHRKSCKSNYHFPCAVEVGSLFLTSCGSNRTNGQRLLCPECVAKGYVHQFRKLVAVRDFHSLQRLNIVRNEKKPLRVAKAAKATVRSGGLMVLAPGEVEFGHEAFHNRTHIFPKCLRTRRCYWSMRKYNTRAIYDCEILDEGDKPTFKITSFDRGFEPLVIRTKSAPDAWNQVHWRINELRHEEYQGKALKIVTRDREQQGLVLFGFSSMLMRWIEDLPGSSNCKNYRFHLLLLQNKPQDALMNFDASGCARTRGYDSKVLSRAKWINRAAGETAKQMGEMKRNHEIASTVYNPSAKRDEAPDQGLPTAIRYRRLPAQVKLRTYVFKSMIQGWGLNAKTNIAKGDMVIEYVGEVLRKQVSDYREAYYNSKGMGIYMFGIANTDYVVDATMRGNSARFINHGCDPNCESKLIVIEGQPHIIIFALRDVLQFEELVYDYKFELDEADKVQCGCGAEKCLGWMN